MRKKTELHPEKIGLIGGTFDPVHHGHLIIAEWIKEILELDTTFFIPLYSHPFSKRADITAVEHRVEMLRRAIDPYDGFKFCDYELEKKGVSYTVDTLRYFKEKYPGSRLHYFIGSDNLKEFYSWKEPDEILKLAKIVVLNRIDGEKVDVPEHPHIIPLPGPIIEISSTHIRNRIKRGLSVRSLIPGAVHDYIQKNKLYK